jgi:hypothetical protein
MLRRRFDHNVNGALKALPGVGFNFDFHIPRLKLRIASAREKTDDAGKQGRLRTPQATVGRREWARDA